MNKITTHQKGFTLIELLLYVSIVGTLLLAVSMFFVMTVESRVKTQSIMEVDQQGALLMDHITQTIRNADTITSPTAGTTSASLTLTVPTGSLSPTIFNTSGNIAQIKEGTGATVSLTNSKVDVTGLIFRNLTRSGTPGIIQVSFTISRVNPSGRSEYTYQKTFTSSAALRQP